MEVTVWEIVGQLRRVTVAELQIARIIRMSPGHDVAMASSRRQHRLLISRFIVR
jgi:hypothetical protein